MINIIAAVLLWPIYWLVMPLRLRASVAILVGDEMLVVKHRFYYGQWNLPGGGVKMNEAPVRAACREIKEELGIEIDETNTKELTTSFILVREYGIISRHKFFEVDLAAKPAISPNKEILKYEWVKSGSDRLGADVRHVFDNL